MRQRADCWCWRQFCSWRLRTRSRFWCHESSAAGWCPAANQLAKLIADELATRHSLQVLHALHGQYRLSGARNRKSCITHSGPSGTDGPTVAAPRALILRPLRPRRLFAVSTHARVAIVGGGWNPPKITPPAASPDSPAQQFPPIYNGLREPSYAL